MKFALKNIHSNRLFLILNVYVANKRDTYIYNINKINGLLNDLRTFIVY